MKHEPTARNAPLGRAELETASRTLADCVAVLHGLLKRLADLSGEKLDALRRADAEALHACAASESEVLERIQHNRRERNAVLARLAQSLRWPGVKSARLTEIADRIPEPFSSSIRARTTALHGIATTLEQKNRLAARVAHNLQHHVRGIFADMAKATQESIVYGPNGNHEQATARSWVDATG